MIDSSQTNMYAPIAIFAFNRAQHLSETLKALSNCTEICKSKVIIFVDGPRDDRDAEGVEQVLAVAKAFKQSSELRVVKRESNLGLAASITSGISTVLAEFESVIVLEDDIVVSPIFLSYMNLALIKFSNDFRVGSIHGYNYPLDEELSSPFFLRGADCWGWATWKRAWSKFEYDGATLKNNLVSHGLVQSFNFNGSYEYMKMLEMQIIGKNNSWAIRWHASLFLQNMLTLYPGKTLVENIGIDGSGTHCGDEGDFKSEFNHHLPSLDGVWVEESLSARYLFERYFLKQKSFKGLVQYYFNKYANPRSILNLLIPRKILELRHSRNQVSWSLSELSYDEIIEKYQGYDDNNIYETVQTTVKEVLDGIYDYERDGFGFTIPNENSQLVDFLEFNFDLKEPLTVVDFGGSLGSTFYQNRRSLSKYSSLEWIVVEQDRFVEIGDQLFNSFHNLSFSTALPEKFDIFFCSSTLQYLPTPFDLLEKVLKLHPKFLVFDRLSLVDSVEDYLTIQKVPESIYKAVYPCWFFSNEKFQKFISAKYELVYIDHASVPLSVGLSQSRSQDCFQVWRRK